MHGNYVYTYYEYYIAILLCSFLVVTNKCYGSTAVYNIYPSWRTMVVLQLRYARTTTAMQLRYDCSTTTLRSHYDYDTTMLWHSTLL